MAGKNTYYRANNGPAGATYARECNLRARDTRIFVDLGKSAREAWEEYWSLVLELAGEMQGGGADE